VASTDFIAGVEIKPATGKPGPDRRPGDKPIGSLTQMGHDPPRQAHRRNAPADQGLRPARRLDDLVFGGLGPDPRRRLRGRALNAGVLDKLMVWCASTEIYIEPGRPHADLEAFEAAMERTTRRSRRRCSTPTRR
jgi:hypothetical protein